MPNGNSFRYHANQWLKPVFNFIFKIGFDPRRLISLRHFPKNYAHRNQLIRIVGTITKRYAIYTDYDDQAGSASGHNFHQDLLVAHYIHENAPERHIDIGSRIDGFVAHVASFRQIDVMDFRELQSTEHPNISFIIADLIYKESAHDSITDSISCLHAIEYFGLGRYGYPIDPLDYIKGFNNIIRMLKTGGTLFIRFPIANQNEVHFNAHRVFHPRDIFTWAIDKSALSLV